jgi:RecB family exonuclease
MTPFLRQVARHYYNGAGDISRLCFVFPNRRALRFFENYLGEEIAAAGNGPAVAPGMYTMNDFIYHATGERPSGRIDLLLELYACYKALNPLAEELDDFIFWGDTLLGDFDDVDKYLVNPEHLFANVSDLREMQDDYSWLTPTQKVAVERFIRHFLTPGTYKERFLQIWRILLPLYRSFRESLKAKGMSYEGMVYRELAERLADGGAADLLKERFPWSERFVFVGLNALNECEKTLLRRIHRAGLCDFCWDYSSEMIKDTDNKSSLFLRDFTVEFPSSFRPDPDGLPQTEFNVLSVPGGISQAKQLPEILSRCTPEPGIETAVVLPDEQLLLPVLNSIPAHVEKLNVTMGYPISGSQIWALLGDIAQLQLHLRSKGGNWMFYHRAVWAVLSNSIIRSVLQDGTAEHLETLRKERRYYIGQEEFASDPLLSVVFRPVVRTAEPDAAQASAINAWLQDILVAVAPLIKNDPSMQLELDFAKVCHESLVSLGRRELPLRAASWFRLLNQTLAASTVPFEGEPLQGLQIMGPLELRALDFENLIILSAGEGTFPRRSVSSSFIPPELRKGFGLPTYEYQDAVWAYYFYRSIQRAHRVWLVYDSRTEGLRGGEPSRYIAQLEMHFHATVNHFEAHTPLGHGPGDDDAVAKTQEHLDILHKGNLSASSVRNYIRCPMLFYYSKVEGLKADKDVTESLDAGMIGNVLHKTMEALYPKGTRADAPFISGLRRDSARIRSLVNENICKELNTFEVAGRNLVFADIICSYVDALLKADLQSLAPGGCIDIIDVEHPGGTDIGGFRFTGYIDRLDSPSPGCVRVVDYKTGRVQPEDLEFDVKPDSIPPIGLQLYIYKLLAEPLARGRNITGAIYQPAHLMSGEEVRELPLDDAYCRRMADELSRVLAEISDLSVPWTRTDDTKKCKMCDFRAICGR